MSRKTIEVDDALYDYIIETSLREPAILAELREETATMPGGGMQISPEQGQLMALLAELIGARRYLEVGTFTGYSSLAVALAMGPEGRLTCCDVSEDYTAVARRYWQKAGVAERVDLRIGPGLDSLDQAIEAGESGSYDFAFVDADKTGYQGYVELCHTLLRSGGLLGIDNVLWGGAVVDTGDKSEDTVAIRRLNAALRDDPRWSLSLVPIGDGLTLLRKR
ncbi:Predicted O-methyltransferase YrrM [Tistlia consotensis]|uniref:Predicted O-methyltransferase YrrM n=1 Tax=Tistlia consotensis USBA 355 TaxID=560819 RepID=A0A1Y6CMW5_9PROT|nr:class I SAM-dependent methyltransferase [Tistlia consotensis]SMF77699.1 Predicted O-methyltransferase YrrM [Tistlia consotensis USBA 355]SNS20794.1 Predicted O-methyltransferase YrrM [Tistlia consotensis]